MKKLISLSGTPSSIRKSYLTYIAVVRSVAQAFGTKLDDPFAKPIIHLKHSKTTVADASKLIAKAVAATGFVANNVSTLKSFSVHIDNVDGVGFVVEAELDDISMVKENSLTITL